MMAGADIKSTLLERALPRAEREAFARELVEYQIEELNGLGDRLRYVAEQEQGPEREQHQAQAHARVTEIVEALRWNADEVVRYVWQWLETPLAEPEDVFAPALLLRALGADQARVQRWLDALPEATRRLADA
ncbi:MAG TPA: hypothetical protein VKN99_05265 [Polyangia bacterium]|nr:hypothetical protein [Polyangia bacterium]